MSLAPAFEVEDHVIGRERIAVVPRHALAEVQYILGRIFVQLPTFEQMRLESKIPREANEWFQ